MLKSLTWQSYLFFVVLLASSCGRPEPRKAVNVDHIELHPIRIERFDRALDSLTEENALAKHRYWKVAYGSFYRDYIERVLKIGQVDDDLAVAQILGQISNSGDFRALRDSVLAKTIDLRVKENELEDAFKRVRYYLPDAELPARFIAFFSGFALQTPIGNDYIGIGLDLFLGAESAFYPAIVDQFPLYISRRFTPDHIVPTVIRGYIENEILPTDRSSAHTTLDQMLHYGKQMYLMDLFLPETADSLKIGYTEKQMAWARHFESQIWQMFVSENLLYQSDRALSVTYFGEAPFTAGLGERNESAPKLGIYIGWQLVRKYMARHPETTVLELLAFHDAQAFLEEARYRGR